MRKYLPILFLIVFIIPSVAFASWWNPFTWNKKPTLYHLPSDIKVNGYRKDDGTKVDSYTRTSPDNIKSNNFSAKGNVNPYTLKKGTKIIIPVPKIIINSLPEKVELPIKSPEITLSTVAITPSPIIPTITPQPIVTPVIVTPVQAIGTMCNGKSWNACSSSQNFVCPPVGDAYCEDPQQKEQLRQQQEQLQIQAQRNQQKADIVSEYQKQSAQIDQQILDIKQKYYKNKAEIESQPIPSSIIQGQEQNLMNKANGQIEQLNDQREQLRLDALRQINSI